MKKIILLLIIAFLSINCLLLEAQPYHPFPTDSAQWSVRHTHNSPFSQDSYQYKMKGDTIINNISYSKIYYSLDLNYNSQNQTLHCFLREDTTKKIFVKYPVGSGLDTTEFMLYDFDLNVGDTVTIRLLYYTTDSLFKLVVSNITTQPTLIDIRTDYLLEPVNSPIWGGGCDYIDWVDGCGGNIIFYNEIIQNGCSNTDDYYNICFWDHGVYVAGGTFCDYSEGINGLQDLDYKLQIVPNPITDISVLEFGVNKFASINFYNLYGKKIRSMETSGTQKILINKKDYLAGYYICKLIASDGTYETCKFIVQ